MTFWNCIRIALAALRLNALRSFLTMLGIIIGIGSVIVMVSISNGAQQQVEDLISNLGANVLRVRPGSSRFGGRLAGAGTATPFAEKDLRIMQDRFPFIEAASGSIDTTAPVVAAGMNWQTVVNGVHRDYLAIHGWVMEQGRAFTDQEVRAGAKVALLGQTVAEKLFGSSNPVGARLRIKNVPFSVIGLLGEKGQSSWGRDQDDLIMIPINTARLRIVGRSSPTVSNEIGRIALQISPFQDLAEAQELLEEFLRGYRKIAPGADDDFSVRNYAEYIRTRSATQETMGLLLAATAAIALLVGGIGIMNIMLVSVTERTREIGIRMAVGARERDILRQFLVEAVTLCVIGSLVGVAIGVATTMFIARLGQWPVLIAPATIMIAIGAAALVGVFFGYYPARKASRLNPIDALRYE